MFVVLPTNGKATLCLFTDHPYPHFSGDGDIQNGGFRKGLFIEDGVLRVGDSQGEGALLRMDFCVKGGGRIVDINDPLAVALKVGIACVPAFRRFGFLPAYTGAGAGGGQAGENREQDQCQNQEDVDAEPDPVPLSAGLRTGNIRGKLIFPGHHEDGEEQPAQGEQEADIDPAVGYKAGKQLAAEKIQCRAACQTDHGPQLCGPDDMGPVAVVEINAGDVHAHNTIGEAGIVVPPIVLGFQLL